jgi:aldehyde:ferredoxin oxidoreductase
LQRAELLLGGPDYVWNPSVHDVNPPRFYEPLPSGPYKGKRAKKSEVEDYKRRYYRAAGWDRNGIPRTEILKRLGLEDVDKTLEKLR